MLLDALSRNSPLFGAPELISLLTTLVGAALGAGLASLTAFVFMRIQQINAAQDGLVTALVELRDFNPDLSSHAWQRAMMVNRGWDMRGVAQLDELNFRMPYVVGSYLKLHGCAFWFQLATIETAWNEYRNTKAKNLYEFSKVETELEARDRIDALIHAVRHVPHFPKIH